MAALKFTINKPLRPLAVLLAGPMGLGLLMAVAFVVALPELRRPRDILFAFGAGLVLGSTIFAPIACALAFRAPLRRWFAEHGFAVQWYTSTLMGFALGYVVASIRHDSSDRYVALAFPAVFLGAIAKMAFASVLRSGDDPTSSRGGGPPPPGAPVPGPPSGRPPTFWRPPKGTVLKT